MTTETIQSDVSQVNPGYSEAEAAEAFLRKWAGDGKDAAKPSVVTASEEDEADDTHETEVSQPEEEEQPESEAETEEQEEDSEDTESEDNEENDSESEDDGKLADDNAVVKVVVDGKEIKTSVAQLKRLAGQEASLTQKSQAVAEDRKKIQELGQLHDHALKSLYDKAVARFKPYADLDWYEAQQKLTPQEFSQLRKDAKEAHAEFTAFDNELRTYVEKQKAESAANLRKAAEACLKAINDPKHPAHIPGWNDTKYAELRDYAVKQGVPQEEVDMLTDPISFSIINKAMKYDAGKKVLTKKKAAAAPARTLKSNKATQSAARTNANAALTRLRKSGSEEDAANVFLERWKTGD